MTWTIADPGLPPSPFGHTPLPKPDPQAHAKSARWIAGKFPGSSRRGRSARVRWAQVPDDLLLDARHEIAGTIRRRVDAFPGRARQPLRDRGLLIELAESASTARELLVEVEAIGLALEVSP